MQEGKGRIYSTWSFLEILCLPLVGDLEEDASAAHELDIPRVYPCHRIRSVGRTSIEGSIST